MIRLYRHFPGLLFFFKLIKILEGFRSPKIFFKNLVAMAARAWLKACRVLLWP